MNRSNATLLLLIAAVCWSTAGLLIKSIEWTPLAIAGARSGIAAIFLWFLCRRIRFTWTWVPILGAVAYAATVMLFVVANKLTTAANAILLQYTAPVYVALFSPWFLGERASKFDWWTMAAAFLGMTLFFVGDLSVGTLVGNILAIISGFSFGWMTLLLRKQKTGAPLQSVFLGNCLAAVLAFPAYFSEGPSSQGWILLAVMGVGQLGLPYLLYARAIREVSALEAILVPFIEPILNPIWVFLLLGEKPSGWALVGGSVILVSVLVRIHFARKRALTTPFA